MHAHGTDLTNQFLIAMPALSDPNFAQAVAFVAQHNAEGAFGIVINRPAEVTLEEIFSQMDLRAATPEIGAQTVYSGGPVDTERGFVLHAPLGDWDATLPVSDDIGITTSRDILEAMAKGEGPEESLLALGYAGWDAGQLEQELGQNTWLSVPASREVLFRTPAEQRWQAAASTLGVDLALLSKEAGHA
ncbi:MAG: YqgE/AlgH family protein [Pseudomonadota bacterium]